MKLLLIGIIVFLVILYIYTYVRYKKMKKNRISAVEDFKNKYHNKEQKELDQSRTNDPITTYTSKFNSTLDYVEKNQLAEETKEMKKLKIVPKRLQF